MSSPLLDELHWLTEALRAHVDWSRSTGSRGLPRCDTHWLEERREHYRRTPLREVPPELPEDTRTDAGFSTPEGRLETHAIVRPSVAAKPVPVIVDTEPAETHDEITNVADPGQSILSSLGGGATSPATKEKQQPRETSTTPIRRLAAENALPLSDEQKRARLVSLRDEVDACTRCGLCNGRNRPAFARGSGASRIVFVGEGPGAEEDAQGIPFVGAAGQLLDRMIGAMGLSRDDVYVCNIIKCRPPNNRKPTDEEIAVCRPFVLEQLQLIEPQVIVALGATAVEGLLGLKLGITRLRGTWRLFEGRIPVMPTFHPAYLLRKPEAKREVWADLQAVLARANRVLPPRS
jgi:uracil-DNA glycosylase